MSFEPDCGCQSTAITLMGEIRNTPCWRNVRATPATAFPAHSFHCSAGRIGVRPPEADAALWPDGARGRFQADFILQRGREGGFARFPPGAGRLRLPGRTARSAPASGPGRRARRESRITHRPGRRRIHIRPVPCAPAIAFAILLLSRTGLADSLSTAWPTPPSVAFGDLYRGVEMANLFADQKTFADATPKEPPTDIMADYERENGLPGFDLRTLSTVISRRLYDISSPLRPGRITTSAPISATRGARCSANRIRPSLFPRCFPCRIPMSFLGAVSARSTTGTVTS